MDRKEAPGVGRTSPEDREALERLFPNFFEELFGADPIDMLSAPSAPENENPPAE